MTHPTPDLLALLALGEDVGADVTDHVRGCPTCDTEVAALRHVVVIGRSVTADDVLMPPPEVVWRRIAAELGSPGGSVIPLPGVTGIPAAEVVPLATADARDETTHEPAYTPDRRARKGRRRWAAVALAAAIALVAGLGIGFGVSRAITPRTDVVGVTTLNALPQWKGANGTATVEKDAQGNRTLVVTVELPPNADVDGQMEVWMSDSRAYDMVSMGFMPGTSGRFTVPPSMDLKTHPIIDVSLEPRGDSNPAHSAISVVRGRLAL